MDQAINEKIDLKKMQNLPIINDREPNKKYTEKEEKSLREISEYEFRNLEEPGLLNRFTYGNASNKYTFVLLDGGRYKLPKFIQRHIESKATPKWEWRPDGQGKMNKQLVSWKPRFQLREVY